MNTGNSESSVQTPFEVLRVILKHPCSLTQALPHSVDPRFILMASTEHSSEYQRQRVWLWANGDSGPGAVAAPHLEKAITHRQC